MNMMMKPSSLLNIILSLLLVASSSDAYTSSLKISGSSFVVRNQHDNTKKQKRGARTSSPFSKRTSSLVMYEPGDAGNNKKSGSEPQPQPIGGNTQQVNAWTAMANTERWISDTLSDGGSNNPYARKEVSYVCEPSDDSALIVAGIFRRLREARQLGEIHGDTQEELLLLNDSSYNPNTLRQTHVIVIPSSKTLNKSFITFDNLLNSINQARRCARDFVTDISLEKTNSDSENNEVGERDWVVSINCAHLHPKFGTKTPEQIIQEMKEQDAKGEVDLHLEEYKERRVKARQSPYPSIVIEVMSSPPPDYKSSRSKPTPQSMPSSSDDDDSNNAKEEEEEESKVTIEDIQKLEALFSQSAAIKPKGDNKSDKAKNDDDAFYEAIEKVSGIQSISVVTPTILAQNWIDKHDSKFDLHTSAFTATDIKHVDSGYEFVFQNLAMQSSKFNTNADLSPPTLQNNKKETNKEVSKDDDSDDTDTDTAGIRQYLVMSNFLSSSATSFEKFASEVTNIIQTLPEISDKVHVSIFHPEHVDKTKRSPVPIFVIEWQRL